MHVLQYKLTSLGGMRFLWLLKTWTRTGVTNVSIHSQKKLYFPNSSHTFVSILGDAIFKSRVGVKLKLRASRKLVYETAVVLAGAGRNECVKVEYMCYEVCSPGRLYSDIVQVSLGILSGSPQGRTGVRSDTSGTRYALTASDSYPPCPLPKKCCQPRQPCELSRDDNTRCHFIY